MAIPNEPLTRTEQYLNRTATGGGTIPDEPLTRAEQYLNKIATGSGDTPEQPITRMEQYLDYIAENGGGGGSDITLETLNVTENGTTNAPSETAYNKVVANVPNTYAAGDEGKVVDNGALVSQTTETISQNGTVNTTTVREVTVNVPNTYVASDEGKVVDGGALVSQTNETVTQNRVVNTTTIKQVTVNVPNTYAASDNGKVVSNGALVSQTAHAEVTANGTIDTTLNNSVVVNVPMKETLSWHQCPEAVRNYLANVDYTGVPYTQSSIETYAPNPAVPATNTKPIGETIDGVTYYNTVPKADTPFVTANKAGTLNPLDHVRWIKSATSNMRDLGGWACDGGTIRYGLLYRSGNLSEADEDLLINELGINTECDLTADGDAAFPGKMRFIGHTSYAMYSLADTGAWRTNLRGIFEAVQYGDPVVFHCSMGADRTGTLACVLEGLLGVSQSDIDKDYELTSFYALRARNGNYQGGTADWAHLMAQIEALDGATIRDKVVRFALDLGFTVADINTFRHDMIDGNPGDITVPTYSVTNALTNCSSSNAATSAEYGGSYSATISANSGYTLDGATVQITMGGTDITASAYSNGAISIANVTGNIAIQISAVAAAPVNLFDPNDTDVSLRGRINSSGNAVSYADGQLVTGFISATDGDVFRIETDKSLTTNNYTGDVAYYDSGKTYKAQSTNATASVWSFSDSGMTGVCTLLPAVTGVGYVRFCVAYTDINNIKIYKQ